MAQERGIMDRVNVLDCTLRDGGYCNHWRFGKKNIEKMINGLVCSNVEIVECGILTDQPEHQEDITLFNNVEQIAKYIWHEKDGNMFVCLANYGAYTFERLPQYDGTSVDGIRVAFHKKDVAEALKVCEQIKKKGYQVFIQPMVSLNYYDEEFLHMIHLINRIEPFAFYIVDSFGAMTKKQLQRLFFLTDHNLKPDIYIGFHSHNNMQMAYANAQTLQMIQTERRLIIDGSIMGMGRGAGNLNTELFVEYLNQIYGKKYQIEPLLVIIDQILQKFYRENYWGYSLSNYLSAKYNVHPDYAKYLTDKQTLNVEDMDHIFLMMKSSEKVVFNSEYIEKLYISYMGKTDDETLDKKDYGKDFYKQEVLLIAPGASSRTEKDKIINYAARHRVISISVNFDYSFCKTDFIFLSNLRRYEALDEVEKERCIVTSNIPVTQVFAKIKYKDLLNRNEFVRDNAGLMLIKYMIHSGARKVVLAGMDGYGKELAETYLDEEMSFPIKVTGAAKKNEGMTEILREFSESIEIEFLTEQRYVYLGKRSSILNMKGDTCY